MNPLLSAPCHTQMHTGHRFLFRLLKQALIQPVCRAVRPGGLLLASGQQQWTPPGPRMDVWLRKLGFRVWRVTKPRRRQGKLGDFHLQSPGSGTLGMRHIDATQTKLPNTPVQINMERHEATNPSFVENTPFGSWIPLVNLQRIVCVCVTLGYGCPVHVARQANNIHLHKGVFSLPFGRVSDPYSQCLGSPCIHACGKAPPHDYLPTFQRVPLVS